MAKKATPSVGQAPDGAFPLYYYTSNLDRFNALVADDEQRRLLRNVAYRTPGDVWAVPELKLERRKDKQPSDFPSPLSDCPVLSLRAWECLAPLIGPCVEPLPIRAKGNEFVLLNVIARCPAFDAERSDGVRRDSFGILYDASKWAFRTGAHIGTDMFRINTEVSRVFVTERFRKTVEAGELVGLLWVVVPLVM